MFATINFDRLSKVSSCFMEEVHKNWFHLWQYWRTLWLQMLRNWWTFWTATVHIILHSGALVTGRRAICDVLAQIPVWKISYRAYFSHYGGSASNKDRAKEVSWRMQASQSKGWDLSCAGEFQFPWYKKGLPLLTWESFLILLKPIRMRQRQSIS